MFKKIDIWILYLVIVLSIILVICFGILVRQTLVGKTKIDSLSKAVIFLVEIPRTLKVIFAWDVQISNNRHANKPRFKRFLTTDRNELLLLSRYDGDIKRSVVEIIDLNDFSVLHTYTPDINEINSKTDTSREEFKKLLVDMNPKRYLMINPLIDEDGNLVFQSLSSPLVKIDYCSNLLWVNDEDQFHHANNIDQDGNYWVSSKIFPYTTNKELVGNEFGNFIDDGINKISPDGKIIYQKSVTQILIENGYSSLLFAQGGKFNRDPIHLNDIEPVLKNNSYMKTGDVFLSSRHLSMIIHFRPSTNELINILTGPFFAPHDVDIISDKEISIFNNNTFFTIKGEGILTNSEVVIYNFETKTFSKKFQNSMKKYKVKTKAEGLADILKDGSMMVEEYEYGRIVFFNSSGELEWEFINKAKNGKIFILEWSRIITNDILIRKLNKIIQNTKCTN